MDCNIIMKYLKILKTSFLFFVFFLKHFRFSNTFLSIDALQVLQHLFIYALSIQKFFKYTIGATSNEKKKSQFEKFVM